MGKRGIWTIPRESIVKTSDEKSGYEPDIIVINQDVINTEPRWENESIIENAKSVKLIVEVVSTNWRCDPAASQAAKECAPREPTFSVYQLIDGEYQVSQFRGIDQIILPTFPAFNLTAEQVFLSSN